jgi:hypothetical protein
MITLLGPVQLNMKANKNKNEVCTDQITNVCPHSSLGGEGDRRNPLARRSSDQTFEHRDVNLKQ